MTYKHSKLKVLLDYNFITSRYNKILKKINHIKDIKNIYLE